VFDSPVDEVSFAALGKKSMLQDLKEIFADQPGRPKPAIGQPPPQPVPVKESVAAGSAPGPVPAEPVAPAAKSVNIESAAAGLIEAGVKFLESMVAGPEQPLQGMFARLVSRDARTSRPVLSVPLPESLTAERLGSAVEGFLNALRR